MNEFKKNRKRIIGVASLLFLNGCATPPPYERPDPYGFGSAANAAPQEISVSWWQEFQSLELNRLVEQALTASPTLEAAQAALREAESLYRAQAGFTRDPQLSAGLGASRQRSANTVSGRVNEPQTFSLYGASLGLLYDPDLSGVNRRRLAALAAQTDHARYQLEGVRLDLIARVLESAFLLAQTAAQEDTLTRLITLQEEELALIKNRLDQGAVAPDAVYAAQSRLEQTRRRLPEIQRQSDAAANQLAVLCGQPPGSFQTPDFTLDQFAVPENLPHRLPSEILRRRPDIQAAEAMLRASHAEYGAAVAERYPQLVLSADIGTQALSSGALFDNGSLIWSLAGQISKPLFSRGLRFRADAARAAFEAAGALYQQSVLQGLRQTADALRQLEAREQSLQAIRAESDAARASIHLTEQRFAFGTADRIELIAVQQRVLQVDFEQAAEQARKLVDTVLYIQSLGGTVSASFPTLPADGPPANICGPLPMSPTNITR
jgi:NodT family efflux transporter outer membrane factor (OMF) lipoprotein